MNGNLRPHRWFCSGAVGVVFLWLAVPTAIGAPITYVFSGPATGTLGATAFTDAQVTMTATADTATITTLATQPSDLCINLSSVTININGIGTTTVAGSSAFAESQAGGAWALVTGTCAAVTGEWFYQTSSLAATYGLITSIGPTTLSASEVQVATASGTLTFTVEPTTFQATLGSSPTTDQSDLWYIPAESGWGMQLVQRGSVIFATLFVYDPSGKPTWYVSTMDNTANLTWTGVLYATNGTYFGVPWNPALFTGTPVGTMTWEAQSVANGTLTYVIAGTTVVKNVTRETLVPVDYSGHYAGGLHDIVTGCPNAAANGTFDLGGVFDITENGTAIKMQNVGANGVTCAYAGTLTQAGQMGAVPGGEFICTDGSSGAISFDEMQVNRSGISGTFTATYGIPAGCQSSGWFGGFRGTTF